MKCKKCNEKATGFLNKPFDFEKIPEKQIDFIFYDKKSKIKVKKFITIDDFYQFKYPSDHLPIMATFNK